MFRFLKVIFYQFYQWGCKYNFANSPDLSAMYMQSLLLTFNLFSLHVLINLILGNTYKPIPSRTEFFIILIITTFIIYLFFIRNKSYLEYNNQFAMITKKQKMITVLFTIIYILFSLLLFFGIAIYIGLHKYK